ncbi:MAG: DUF362 domain-containing protein [Negativicutes bacterium]
MKRREFIQWTAAGSMTLMGLSGCGTNKSSADVGLPKKNPEPVSQPPVSSTASPQMVVVNGTDPDELMERGLQAMGGIGRFVKKGQTVVIKPNFSVPRTPDQAATTKLSGEFYTSVNAGGSILQSLQYSKDVLEVDVFINFPILKHHNGAGLTMGLKNMMGLVWDRGFFHRTDLHRTIAELSAFRKPHLVIMDAIKGITTHGPMGPGTIREYKQVIFSTDPVAIDAYGAELFGMKAADIGHVAIAAELGIGAIDWKKLNPVHV